MKAKLILIGVVSSLVLGGLWYFLAWSPAGEKLDEAKAQRAVAEVEAQKLQGRLSHLRVLEQNAAVLDADKARFSVAMPETDKLDEFIRQVNERAARSQVNFVSIAPTPPTVGDEAAAAAAGPGVVSLTMSVEGDYFKILRFLEELREGPRLVTVETFSISRPGDNPTMSASIGGRMFVNPTAAAEAAPSTSA